MHYKLRKFCGHQNLLYTSEIEFSSLYLKLKVIKEFKFYNYWEEWACLTPTALILF